MIPDSIEPRGSILTTSIRLDSSWPKSVDRHDRHRLYSYLKTRFGIPVQTFDGYLIFKRKKSWWLLRDTPLLERFSHLKVSIIGMRAFNQIQEFIKPTTRLIQVFGRFATKRVHSIDRGQLDLLRNGNTLPGPADDQDGYIILSFKDQPLGLGLLIKGTIHSQLPRKDYLYISL
jgi:NOL1/NOP2/fmu family ribosome biogenesis protein